jgi:hypothetical protein
MKEESTATATTPSTAFYKLQLLLLLQPSTSYSYYSFYSLLQATTKKLVRLRYKKEKNKTRDKEE